MKQVNIKRIITLRKQGLVPRAIGEQYALSGERIRQLLIQYAPDVVAARYMPRTCPCCKQSFIPKRGNEPIYCSRACGRQSRLKPHIDSLATHVCKWLASIQHGRCRVCLKAKPFAEMTALGNRRGLTMVQCLECTRNRSAVSRAKSQKSHTPLTCSVNSATLRN